MYLLGYDVGSSFVKIALLEAETGNLAASATYPDKEMGILASHPGWAEENLEIWWENAKTCTALLKLKTSFNVSEIAAIGLSYQMHGLVVIDKNKRMLRPSIIWCDSRAAHIGAKAFREIGKEKCMKHLLNFPGNFTV